MRIFTTIAVLLTLGLPAYAGTADIVQERAFADVAMTDGFPLPVCGGPAGCTDR